MGLGNCQRCGDPMFPAPSARPSYCICKTRSLLKEILCVLRGHLWRGRITNDRLTGAPRVYCECKRCGRFGSNEGVERRKDRATRAEELLIAWEWAFNHGRPEHEAEGRFHWLCEFADGFTGGRCHD